MNLNLIQVLTSNNFISTINRWFIGTITLFYFGLAFSIPWTKSMWLIFLTSYLQWALVHFFTTRRPQLIPAKLTPTLRSTLKNLGLLLAILMTFSYASLFILINNSSWNLIQQLLVAATICGCLLGANLIILKHAISQANSSDTNREVQ